jgi:hypothetical protein
MEPLLQGLWRPIVVDVTPEEVHVQWRADPPPKGSGEMATLGRVSGAELRTRYAAGAKKQLALVPGPEWSPRLPFGVVSHRSAVSIRNVTVTPLPDPTKGPP